MPDPARVRLANLWKRRKLVLVPVALALVVDVPLGYYLAGSSSVDQISVQIVSATRSKGTYFGRFDINYTLMIRASSPRALMLVELWPPSLTLTVDSYLLGGGAFSYPSDSWSDGYDHLVPGGSLTYSVWYLASFATPPPAKEAIATLNATKTNTLSLSAYFPVAFAGWYHTVQDFGIKRTTSSSWNWNTTQQAPAENRPVRGHRQQM